MQISQHVFDEIVITLGSSSNESGGLFGSKNDRDIIDIFYFDKGRRSNASEYVPEIDVLQQQLILWNMSHIKFKGIIHSHTISDKLSPKDIYMARKILIMNKISSIYMPIYQINNPKLIWYEVSDKDVVLIDSPEII